MRDIYVITEGATEREVGLVLYERRVLSQAARPRPPKWKSQFGSREGYEKVITALSTGGNLLSTIQAAGGRLLLVFDQEDSPSPSSRAGQIARDLQQGDPAFWENISFAPIQGWANLFECNANNLHIVLHISGADIRGINRRDFDGYILELLQGSAKRNIATQLAPPGVAPTELLKKAEEELDQLMKNNGYSWTHAKSWLYAYITVFQFRQSHVWFAKKVVNSAPESELQRVFAPLIEAWNRLAT